MKQYHQLMQHVLINGTEKGDRTGTGTRSVFGYQMRFDLRDGFPIVTTKKVHFKSVVAELLWFLSGSTNNNDLKDMGCSIWDEWARPDGSLGPIYGKQWRQWEGDVLDIDVTPLSADGASMKFTAKVTRAYIDQITQVIDGIKRDPNGRRHIVSAWNPADIPGMALAPCHALFQFDVTGGRLSCQLYQRSADIFLGVPFNIASYSLLTHMMAQQCDLEVGDFIWTGGDCHLYVNHFEQVALQLSRTPRALPLLVFARRPDSIFDYKPEDVLLTGYDPEPGIKAPVAV